MLGISLKLLITLSFLHHSYFFLSESKTLPNHIHVDLHLKSDVQVGAELVQACDEEVLDVINQEF